MSWLERYYNNQARVSDQQDFLKQVGHTEQGRSISDTQFRSMLDSIRTRLKLNPTDRLLDLCCGNGVFTRHLAKDVNHVVGVDFSKELIAIAEARHNRENISYCIHNVNEIDKIQNWNTKKFDKVLMNAALQHFTLADFEKLLEKVLGNMTRDKLLLFSFVPEFNKQETFIKALRPNFKRWLRLKLGRDLLGEWWQRDEISIICSRLGIKVEFLDIDSGLDGSRYRFDIRMWQA